jgi:Putative restriction endonuclease
MRTHVTCAAEGFDRRSFTVAEILRMQDAGLLPEEENFELIEGEIVPMRAKQRSDILLAIEVAATSLAYDRGLKARLCARHGVNELRVIDAERRRTFVHRGPGPAGWRTIVERGRDEALTSPALPGFSVELGSI